MADTNYEYVKQLNAELAAARDAGARVEGMRARAEAELAAARDREKGLREAIAWVCGVGDDFLSEAERKERGLPIYWWRKELRRRAALAPETHDEGKP